MTTPAFESYTQWLEVSYKDLAVQAEFKNISKQPFDLFTSYQPAGSYPDPPTPDFLLQIVISVQPGTVAKIDLGDGYFEHHSWSEDILLAPPMTSCDYEVDGDSSLFLMPISSVAVEALLQDTSLSLRSFERLYDSGFRDPFLSAYISRLWEEREGPLQRLLLEGAVATIVATLLRLADNKQQNSESPVLSKSQINKIFVHLENHLDETITVKTLAALVGLSESHFSRAFKQSLGDSPYRYLLRRRLEVSKHLLITTKMSLAEVALEVGFSSQAHFTSTFKRLLGTTPGAVRKG